MDYESGELNLVWKALADPTRRTILDLLRQRPHTTGELSAAFDLSRYAIMKHLTVLVEAGMVAVRREGRTRWNHLNIVPLQRMYERWLKPYEAEWAESLLNVQRVAEKIAENQLTGGSQMVAENFKINIAQDVVIEADPLTVFNAILEPSAWWAHSFSGNPVAIHLEPVVGGRFWEEMSEDEGALYATVTYVKRGEKLQLRGPMGMSGAVSGFITFDLEPQDATTVLKLTHRVVGEVTEKDAEGYTQGWQELLGTHLKGFVEDGTRVERG